jgi:hypothetical protein
MNPLRLAAAAALVAASALAAAQDKPAATAPGSAPASAPAAALTGKFGFVNTERILRDAIPA